VIIIALLTSITRREWAVVGVCAGVGALLWLISAIGSRFGFGKRRKQRPWRGGTYVSQERPTRKPLHDRS
jgi:hypothetical protein